MISHLGESKCPLRCRMLPAGEHCLPIGPRGTTAPVEGAVQEVEPNGRPKLYVPELELHCAGKCYGLSFATGTVRATGTFFAADTKVTGDEKRFDYILCYSCRRCKREVKSYAVRIIPYSPISPSLPHVEVVKMAEWPPFSPPIPARLISMVGPDRDLFLKGRQAEFNGLGIGAFAYYRRIVESQKNRLLDEIIRVARRVNASPDAISLLENAKVETQFARAVAAVKDAIPQALLIKGHNPLTLLHAALSRDLHAASDDECLKTANDIRIILSELADRLSQALKDERELDTALTRLLNSP